MSGESTLIVNVSVPSEYPSAVARRFSEILGPFVKRFNASETKICKLPSKGRMVVQKDKQMIMSDSATASQMSTNSESDFSLCTNSSEMISNIHSLCSLLWETAQPLTTLDVKNYIRKTK